MMETAGAQTTTRETEKYSINVKYYYITILYNIILLDQSYAPLYRIIRSVQSVDENARRVVRKNV